MKNFLVTFFACAIVIFLVTVLGANLIFNSVWGIILFVSLVLTVIVCLFERQSTQVEDLKLRIEQLEAALRQNEEENV